MRIDHAALFCRDLEQMRQFFIDYFDARSNEQYHNPRTGLRTYILSFTEGRTRLELMQRTEQREPSSSLEWPSRDGRRQSQRPDVQDADPSQPTIGYVHLSFAVGSCTRGQRNDVSNRKPPYERNPDFMGCSRFVSSSLSVKCLPSTDTPYTKGFSIFYTILSQR